MKHRKSIFNPIAALLLAFPFAFLLSAQDGPPQDHEAQAARVNTVGAGLFPGRPKADAATVARGKASYMTNCAYCHGEDARGGDNGGTNLLRADVIMKDQNGEVLRTFLANSTGQQHSGVREGPQKFQFAPEQAADIAAFIHDFRLNSRDPGRMRPPTVVVGNAQAGQALFKTKCATCHSADSDLKGIASRITDPRALQQTWLMPVVISDRSAPAASKYKPVTVTVTLASGTKVEGVLGRLDDFIVTLTTADGAAKSFRRENGQPRIEVHDPMKGHKDLLPTYKDKDIHDVTAYMVTLR